MAYKFNGSNQFLNATAPVSEPPLTMAYWTNVPAFGGVIVGLCDNGSSANRYLSGFDSPAPHYASCVAFNASNTAGVAATTTTASLNTWHHLGCVFTSTSSRTSYLDGGGSATNTTSIVPTVASINILRVGNQRFNGVNVSHSQPNVAELGIWNVALTADEIASLAKGMTCDKVRPQSLVFYAPLVRDLIDYKGGLTITNNNTATVANHPRVYA